MSGLTYTPKRNRRGVTLVELLVVVTLLSILLGIAATAARTGARGKKQREAARQVNAFIAGARTRALELGRSVGVEIVNNRPNEPQAGLTLFMVETPPPYAGNLTNSTCSISTVPTFGGVDSQGNNIGGKLTVRFNSTSDTLLLENDFLTRGDVVFFGYSNQPYYIDLPGAAASGSRDVVITWNIDQPAPFPWYTSSMGTITGPFKIYRQPQRNSVTPLQMPTGVCIDLAFSGLGTTGYGTNSTGIASQAFTGTPTTEEYPKIMFGPKGGVDAYYWQSGVTTTAVNTSATLPVGNINLLIGRYDKVIAVTDLGNDLSLPANVLSLFTAPTDDGSNIADPEAMWVSINRLTGNIATTNNGAVSNTVASAPEAIASARRFAKQAQNISGR
ncbi:prepilin-type N-terminal cleavage/methylation domain-containing protein [Blastopirellula sp. J2-11]|uniref:prepilin-type N-terminal cleavage/methylation domain-containing protein n=1 Tax=Blastopirellula sp. J2-11 TaxID=2943192 RepID=UPI0021C7764C|nr:prepilin-type N-terminal cleavage/methylation domain-containing protein [Blastopirellula sp. J2-11]UUO05258.1 prepilin-type N-terminal cleavage/methylation domain-containing protein [Blastopirellula sp. J2-11]